MADVMIRERMVAYATQDLSNERVVGARVFMFDLSIEVLRCLRKADDDSKLGI